MRRPSNLAVANAASTVIGAYIRYPCILLCIFSSGPIRSNNSKIYFRSKTPIFVAVFFSVQMNRTCFLCVPAFVGNNGMLREAKSLNAENF
jgi:hypothetical protein